LAAGKAGGGVALLITVTVGGSFEPRERNDFMVGRDGMFDVEVQVEIMLPFRVSLQYEYCMFRAAFAKKPDRNTLKISTM